MRLVSESTNRSIKIAKDIQLHILKEVKKVRLISGPADTRALRFHGASPQGNHKPVSLSSVISPRDYVVYTKKFY